MSSGVILTSGMFFRVYNLLLIGIGIGIENRIRNGIDSEADTDPELNKLSP